MFESPVPGDESPLYTPVEERDQSAWTSPAAGVIGAVTDMGAGWAA